MGMIDWSIGISFRHRKIIQERLSIRILNIFSSLNLDQCGFFDVLEKLSFRNLIHENANAFLSDRGLMI
jgi:hypothetical protein